MGFQISPSVNFSSGILTFKLSRVSWVAGRVSVLSTLVLLNAFSSLIYTMVSYLPAGTIHVKMATIIATATEEQNKVVAEVGENVERISTLNEDALTNQLGVTGAIASLSDSAQSLDILVDSFKLEKK